MLKNAFILLIVCAMGIVPSPAMGQGGAIGMISSVISASMITDEGTFQQSLLPRDVNVPLAPPPPAEPDPDPAEAACRQNERGSAGLATMTGEDCLESRIRGLASWEDFEGVGDYFARDSMICNCLNGNTLGPRVMNNSGVETQSRVVLSVREEFVQIQRDLDTLNNGMSINALAFAVDEITSESSLRYNFSVDLNQQRAATELKMNRLISRLNRVFPEGERSIEISDLLKQLDIYEPPERGTSLSTYDDTSDIECLSRTMFEAYQLLPRNDAFYQAVAALPANFDSREWNRDALFTRLNRPDVPPAERIQLESRMKFLDANPLLLNLFNTPASGPGASTISEAQSDAFRVLRDLSRNCPQGQGCWHNVAHDATKMNDYRRSIGSIMARPELRAYMANSSQIDSNFLLDPNRVVDPTRVPIRSPFLYISRLALMSDTLTDGCSTKDREQCLIEMNRQCKVFPAEIELQDLPPTNENVQTLIQDARVHLTPRSEQYRDFAKRMCVDPIAGSNGRPAQNFAQFRQQYCRNPNNAANCRSNYPAGHQAILLSFFETRDQRLPNTHDLADFLRTGRFGEITPEMARVAQQFTGNLEAFEARNGRDTHVARNGRIVRGPVQEVSAQSAQVSTQNEQVNSRIAQRVSTPVQPALGPVGIDQSSQGGASSSFIPGPPAAGAQAQGPEDIQRQIEEGFTRARAAQRERSDIERRLEDRENPPSAAESAAANARIEALQREISQLRGNLDALTSGRAARQRTEQQQVVQQQPQSEPEQRRRASARNGEDDDDEPNRQPAAAQPTAGSSALASTQGQTGGGNQAGSQMNSGGAGLGSGVPLAQVAQRRSSGGGAVSGEALFSALYNGELENVRLVGEPSEWGPETEVPVAPDIYTQILGRENLNLVSAVALKRVQDMRTSAERVYLQIRPVGSREAAAVPVVAVRRPDGQYVLEFEGGRSPAAAPVTGPQDSDLFERFQGVFEALPGR